jgi:hypothetical protein
MAHLSSTTLVVIGESAPDALRPLAGLANVRARSLSGWEDADATAWERSVSTPYLVHDHDPLAHVAAAWTEFYDDAATLEVLQLEIDRLIADLDRGTASLPDYYVVLAPETLAPTLRHWWLGVMSSASPTRVIPWSDPEASLRSLLRRLPTGRPWPDYDPWLRGVPTSVPDRVGLAP